ncbi:MAG: hypothetical protein BAJALOKI2v1_620005 [Promethearchaeota archaeon]|nr:MAG: hypothetical protein BAJALOKI2v1_620005 [Candidatus Lokiarchaeota archaeon]
MYPLKLVLFLLILYFNCVDLFASHFKSIHKNLISIVCLDVKNWALLKIYCKG